MNPATPSLPLPPIPVGNSTAVLTPIRSLPLGIDPRQIVREDEGGAKPVSAMDRNDGLIRQRKTRIEVTDCPGVPSGNLSEKNVRKHRSGQSKLSRPDAFHIHDWHDAADNDRKLHEPRGSEFFRTDWGIGSSEIHRPAFYLPDAGTRSYGWYLIFTRSRPRRLLPIWPKSDTRTLIQLPAPLPIGLAYTRPPNTKSRQLLESGLRAGA